MHPRNIFIRHLDTIRLYVGAKEISIFHQQLDDALEIVDESSCTGSVLVENVSQLPPKTVTLFEQIEQQSSPVALQANHLVVHDEMTTIIKLIDEGLDSADNVTPETSSNLVLRKTSDAVAKPSQPFWLKFVFNQTKPSWFQHYETGLQSQLPSSEIHLSRLLDSTPILINLVLENIELSSDLLTKLCSRSVLQTRVAALAKSESIGLIMLHCTDFNQINKKFGHEHGDKVIREIANALRPITRDTDILSRFSGALFGIGFSLDEDEDVALFAQKLQHALQHNQYLDGAINLTFNIGAATIKSGEMFKDAAERTSILISRADQALTAAQQEKIPSIIVWSNDDFSLHQQQFNYLGGIFTADTVTDYRNMLLLWDVSSLIADKYEFSHLLQSVVQRLAQTFDFLCAGVISSPDKTDQKLLYSISSEDDAVALAEEHQVLKPMLQQMQLSVQSNYKPSERFFEDKLLLVFPLKIDSPDCFFISGVAEKFQVTHDTKVLLSGLIRQLGKALRRSRLEEELNRKLESQNEQLQHELAVLKEGIQESSVVFQSAIMHKLMKHAKRAATTDTTVLVTGESGTGKERLINALHTLGPRTDKPFVIVDCGSIPEALIESELFGYVKGAFTGAQNSSKGKVTDADGGVLVLDEVGELPLKMQTKLLRFVQEKHYTPVGGNKLLDVDVKIIAVTNRNLAEEVDKGAFRRDLYYRLNVLTLHNPPLRERSEDIPLLSQHFLKKFSEQFNTGKKNLSANAMQKMQQYSWPGNIRELENRLMQATLMCEGDFIEWELLNVESEHIQSANVIEKSNSSDSAKIIPAANLISPNNFNDNLQSVAENPDNFNRSSQVLRGAEDVVENITSILKESFNSYHQHPHFFNAPIGSWIEDDLILQTYNQSSEKMRTTAARLHISQSKARRRVDKILAMRADEPQYRPPNWANIVEAMLPISKGEVVINDCLAEIKLIVMSVILDVATFSMAQAAEMLGVSEPTFYKLKKTLEAKAT